ncbi:MAG: hypothetical protein ABIW02_03040 [Nitrosospira sp.]
MPTAKPRNLFVIAFSVARESMFVLLVACGAIYLQVNTPRQSRGVSLGGLGSRQEALMLLGFVFVIMAITFFQERKIERALGALGALRAMSGSRVLVIKGGSRNISPDAMLCTATLLS